MLRIKNTLFVAGSFLCFGAFSQNTALHFDSLSTYVQTTYPGISGGTQARTIEAWIKTTSNYNPTAGGKQGVIADYGSFTTGGRFTFCVLWSNAIRIEVGGNGLSGNIAVNDGNWHHVAVVYNPSATNKYSLYVDSVLDATGNLTVTTNTGSTTKLRIGRRIDGVNNFRGEIDEVRFFNYSRTLAQIGGERNTEYCTLPSGLVAYYKLNEGVANANNTGKTIAINYAGNQDGTLTGFLLTGTTRNWVAGPNLSPGLNKSIFKDSVCNAYTTSTGKVFTSTGIYYDTLTNSVMCDSMVKYDLTFVTVDDSVYKTGNKLSSYDRWASHQWIDCNNGTALISGATNWNYTPTVTGNYAVIVTKGNCVDTSDCFAVTISTTSLNEEINKEIKLFPNPTNGMMTLSTDLLIRSIIIIDVTGKVVSTSSKSVNLDLTKLPKGIYFAKIQTNKGIVFKKILKE